MTDIEILNKAITTLESISVPVVLLEQVTIPIKNTSKNLRILRDAITQAVKASEEEKKKEEETDERAVDAEGSNDS